MSRARRLAAGLALGVALALAAALLRPGPILRWALARASRGPDRLSVAVVYGNFARGLTLERVVWSRPGASLEARRVDVTWDWPALLRREIRLESVAVTGARLRVEPAAFVAARARDPARWTWSIRRFAVERAIVEVRGPAATRRVAVTSARGGLTRSRRAWLQAAIALPEGPARLRLAGEPGRWSVSGEGAWSGARWRAAGEARGPRWSARLEAARPARAATLRVNATGQGYSPGGLSAQGAFQASLSSGPRLAGGFAAAGGGADFEARLSSGAEGFARGRVSWSRRTARARWSFSAAPLLAFWGARADSLDVSGRLEGAWASPRWELRATAANLRHRSGSVKGLAVSASGEGAAFSARLSAAQPRLRALTARRAAVAARGRLERHELSFELDAGSVAARGRAEAGWRAGAWTSRWSELAVTKPRAMRLERPFTARLERGRLTLDGLALAGEKGSRLELSALLVGQRWSRFSARAAFDLEALWELGWLATPLGGRFDAALDLTGDLRAPSGTIAASIEHAALGPLEAGHAELAARLDGALARLQRFDWNLGRGRARLSGSLPLKLSSEGPDFALRLEADGLSVGAFARRLTALTLVSPRLGADVTIARAGGRWRLSGGGRVEAASASLPVAGLRFGRVGADFAAEDRRLTLKRTELRPEGKGAGAELSGAVGLDGPALRFTGRRLRFDTGRGLSGQADADVGVTGSWRAPVVQGVAQISRADFVPLTGRERRRIDQENEARPTGAPGALAADLRFVFERNVWYKEKATSIELKGDVRLRKKPYEPSRLVGTVETVRGDYVYFSRVFALEQGAIKFGGAQPEEAALAARALYVDEPTRTKVHLQLAGTLREPKLSLTSEPPMEERDIVSFLAFGRPLYEVSGAEGRKVGGTEEAAKVMADYLSQGLRRYLPPQLGLDVFRVDVNSGRAGLTVGRYLTRRLFVSYGQTMGTEGERKVDAQYSLSPHWSVETQNTSQRGTSDNIVDLLFSFGFR